MTAPMAVEQPPEAVSPEEQHKAKLKKLRGPGYPGIDADETTKVAFVKQLREVTGEGT